MTSRARDVVRNLFGYYMSDPGHLPEGWRQYCKSKDAAAIARVVGDYIAGMTDRFALDEQQRLAKGGVP
jgi:dGTPase